MRVSSTHLISEQIVVRLEIQNIDTIELNMIQKKTGKDRTGIEPVTFCV